MTVGFDVGTDRSKPTVTGEARAVTNQPRDEVRVGGHAEAMGPGGGRAARPPARLGDGMVAIDCWRDADMYTDWASRSPRHG